MHDRSRCTVTWPIIDILYRPLCCIIGLIHEMIPAQLCMGGSRNFRQDGQWRIQGVLNEGGGGALGASAPQLSP